MCTQSGDHSLSRSNLPGARVPPSHTLAALVEAPAITASLGNYSLLKAQSLTVAAPGLRAPFLSGWPYTLQLDGAAPPGVTLNLTSGAINFTPAAGFVGSVTFAVRAVTACPDQQLSSAPLSVTIQGGAR